MIDFELEKALLETQEDLKLLTMLIDKSVNPSSHPDTRQDNQFASYWFSQSLHYRKPGYEDLELAASYEKKAVDISREVKYYIENKSK